MKMRYLVPATLLLLAACSQVPAPDSLTQLKPASFGTPNWDYASDLGRHSTGVYAVGTTHGGLHGVSGGLSDAFVRRYDGSGALLWGRQFGTAAREYATGVAGDRSDSAYVVGQTSGSLAGARGGNDAFVRKYNKNGGVVWTRQFGTSAHDDAEDVATSGTDTVYVVGTTYGDVAGSVGNGDGYIVKYNPLGSVVWTRQFGTFQKDTVADVAVDSSGNAYVVGTTTGSFGAANGGGSDMFVRKYTPAGGVAWTKQLHFSGADYGVAVAISGGSVYLAGDYHYNSGGSDRDVRVVQYSTAGTAGWSKRFGPVGDDGVYDVSADASGVVFGGWTYTSLAGPHQGGVE